MQTFEGQPLESGFLVAGEWINTGQRVEINSPYTNKPIGSTRIGTKKDLEHAISAAENSSAELRQIPAYKRKDALLSVAAKIREHKNTLVRLMTLEAGKPVKAARVEVDRAVLTF